MPMDPSQVMNMDPAQLKNMLGMLKKNPAMLKSMMKMVPGGDKMDEKQLLDQLEAVEKMDPATLQRMMKFGQWGKAKFDAVKPYYDRANAAVGGHLLKILVLLVLFCCYRFIAWLFFGSWLFYPSPSSSSSSAAAAAAASSFGGDASSFGGDASSFGGSMDGGLDGAAMEVGVGAMGGVGSSGGGSVGGSDDAEDEFD